MAVKECPKCNKVVAIAKKICECSHVFLEKKRWGFQETPVVITPDRLRRSRSPHVDSRPVREKKPKYHGDFVYNNISKTNKETTDNNESRGGNPPVGSKRSSTKERLAETEKDTKDAKDAKDTKSVTKSPDVKHEEMLKKESEAGNQVKSTKKDSKENQTTETTESMDPKQTDEKDSKSKTPPNEKDGKPKTTPDEKDSKPKTLSNENDGKPKTSPNEKDSMFMKNELRPEVKNTDVVEKLYPKRDRTKTTRYEDYYIKKQNRKETSGHGAIGVQNAAVVNTPKRSGKTPQNNKDFLGTGDDTVTDDNTTDTDKSKSKKIELPTDQGNRKTSLDKESVGDSSEGSKCPSNDGGDKGDRCNAKEEFTTTTNNEKEEIGLQPHTNIAKVTEIQTPFEKIEMQSKNNSPSATTEGKTHLGELENGDKAKEIQSQSVKVENDNSRGKLNSTALESTSTVTYNDMKVDSKSCVPLKDSRILIEDIDAIIDVMTVSSSTEDSTSYNANIHADESVSECESVFTDDGVKLKLVRIPNTIKEHLKNSKKNKSETPENDDIPLIKLRIKEAEKTSGNTNDITLKRPVGRPRKHPVVINKTKRPVGRPKKVSKDMETTPVKQFDAYGNQQKLKRSHTDAMSFVVYGEQYYRHSDFDDEDDGDDEADPDYKSPKRVALDAEASSHRRTDRPGRRCFLSPPQMMANAKMDRIRNEILETVETEKLKKKLTKRNAFEIPPEKKELYSHILKEINRRILSQAFSYNVSKLV